MSYDRRITDLAARAAAAAAKNAEIAPQLLFADITFVLADAVEDGRIVLGPIEATRPPIVTDEVVEPQSLGAIPGSHPTDQAPSGLGASRFDPERIGRWFSIAEDGAPMPEVFVLCWDGQTTFVDWCGSKVDFGSGVTHWIPYELPPGTTNDMHDGRRAFASVDTLPKGQDAKQGLAGTEGSAVAATSGETPTPGPAIDQDGGEA